MEEQVERLAREGITALVVVPLTFVCEHLETRYDLDLELRAGERVALLGPNGAGKTTLIRIAMGMLEPQRGSVRVFGLDPRERPLEARGEADEMHERFADDRQHQGRSGKSGRESAIRYPWCIDRRHGAPYEKRTAMPSFFNSRNPDRGQWSVAM